MSVGVFGRALAAMLRDLPGRVYVELPTTLRREADSLASSLNASGKHGKCLIFVAEPTAVDPDWVVPAEDLLAWRTSEDRTFVLVGGAVEPDSSFATSAVPFMTSAFPGMRGGTCGPAALARATVSEAFSGNEPDPDAVASFEGAAPWVFDLLARSLQGSPSPTQGWQERLLVRWAKVVAELEDAIVAACTCGRRITAWDAWELVRLAGFPRPSFGTVPSDPPPHADEVRDVWLDRVASDWQEFFEDHVRTAGVATVLDRLAAASAIPGTRRWGGYDWERAAREAQRFAAAPSDLGRQLFHRKGFGPDEGPVSPNDWRAVRAEEIGAALEATGSEPALSPVEGFLTKGDGFPPVLDTRRGGPPKPSGRSDKVPVEGLSVLAEGIGSRLAVVGEADEETDCVIEEVSVQVVPKTGLSVRSDPTLRVSGSALQIGFGVVMDVKTRTDGPVRWSPSRRLKVAVSVRDVVGGVRQPRREIEMYLGIVVPSPYWPTVLASDRDGEVVISPASDVRFDSAADGSGRTPTESPELLVSREANAAILAFDGRWDAGASSFRGPSSFAYPQVVSDGPGDAGYDFDAIVRLFDDAVLTTGSDPNPVEATVVRVLESQPLPTNPLGRSSADEPLGEPSRSSRDAPLGRYQTAVATALVRDLPGSEPPTTEGGSLFQLVVPSTTGEIPRSLAFGAKPTSTSGAAGPWPGLGDGPSTALRSSPAWDRFNDEARKVAGSGLAGGVADWLSAIDAVAVGPPAVRRYLQAHRDLIDAARTPTDLFWARHPFSVFLVDGSRGPEWGTLKAVFLSPMHPIRLGWLLGAQLHARALPLGSDLASMVDGWNFPAAGVAPGPGGSTSQLVAMPLDPGEDGDMAAWGALVPISANGIVRPPLSGAGARLPWGGRTGLNEKAVRQSLEDYRIAHPFLNSLQIELRSAIEAPRSAEVDRAVLAWAGDAGRDLGGVIRVLDSDRRLGDMPSRDVLSSWPTGTGRGRFSWVVRGADEELPGPVDVAFVENAAPFTFVAEGAAVAPVAPLPIRRFPIATGTGNEVDYLYAGGGRDLVGLEDLLSAFEPASLALRVVTTGRALHAERDVRWEVVGDINMEPSQMARLAQSADDRRQLWEWQPGLLAGRRGTGATRGARYVLAKAPRSLVAGLRRNLGLDESQADDLLRELGGRGIGLATLRRPGTTQEAEAAGLFYTARLLTGFHGCELPPNWLPNGWYLGLMPLDPMRGIVASMGNGRPEDSRADLCLVLLGEIDGTVRLKLVPVECKHRGSAASPASPPSAKDRRGAVEQAAASSARLRDFQDGLRVSAAGNAVDAAGRLQALATLVDLALKFGPNEPLAEQRARAVQEILLGRAELEVGPGMVVWSLSGESGAGEDYIVAQDGGDGVLELVVRPKSLGSFLWRDGEASSSERELRVGLDELLRGRLAFGAGLVLREDLEEQLLSELGFADHRDAGAEAGGPRTPSKGSRAGDVSQATERMLPRGEVVLSRNEAGEGHQSLKPLPPTEAEGQDCEGGVVGGRSPGAPSPDAFVGSEASARFTLVGEMSSSGQLVALDLDQPKAIGVFGYMGSGKSYLLGAIIEGASANLPGLNVLRSPLAVVVFNYRRNAADRFELASLTRPNDEPVDVERLREAYGAGPSAVEDVHVLCLPGELRGRRAEYSGATASELRFKPSSLDVEEWELLMGEPGSDAVFARTIRTSLRELRREGSITLDGLRDHLSERLQKGSLSAAELRLEAADRMLSEEHGTDFSDVVRAGRVLVVDLRQPMFNRDDAMKLMLVCASQIAKQRTSFNKLVVFDEAHEYMTEAFGERFDARIRYMRHEGSSYVFATQDVASVPVGIRRHLGTNFVFSLQTRDNIADMVRLAPEFATVPLQHVEPGSCYVTSSASTGNFFAAPRLVQVRPRATAHGGKSRIFDD